MKELRKFIKKIIGTYKPYFIHKTAIIQNRDIKIGKETHINEHVIIRNHGKIEIGEYVQIGPFSVIFPGGGVVIKNNVLMGPHCVLAAANHDYIQTEKPIRFSGEISKGPIIIEENVWIGANCTITDGVIIGHDAVIGANSVVTKSVKPFEVVGGVPAKSLGFRKKQ